MSLCYYCHRQTYPGPKTGRATAKTATRDHRIPTSRGGKALPNNTVNACYECNQDKGALTEREYMEVLAYRRRQAMGLAELNEIDHDPNELVLTLKDHEFLYSVGIACEEAAWTTE